jgi:hypothetical protein
LSPTRRSARASPLETLCRTLSPTRRSARASPLETLCRTLRSRHPAPLRQARTTPGAGPSVLHTPYRSGKPERHFVSASRSIPCATLRIVRESPLDTSCDTPHRTRHLLDRRSSKLDAERHVHTISFDTAYPIRSAPEFRSGPLTPLRSSWLPVRTEALSGHPARTRRCRTADKSATRDQTNRLDSRNVNSEASSDTFVTTNRSRCIPKHARRTEMRRFEDRLRR